jgi:hypothetical protein
MKESVCVYIYQWNGRYIGRIYSLDMSTLYYETDYKFDLVTVDKLLQDYVDLNNLYTRKRGIIR